MRALPILLLLAACAAQGPSPPPAQPLPPVQSSGAADPTRQAVLSTSWAFATPGRLAGRPAEAARATGQVEYLAAALAADQRWIGARPTVIPDLRDARAELRDALGIPRAAPDEAVGRAMLDAAAALDAGNRGGATAALGTVSPAPALTLARLESLPPLPRTAAATGEAQAEMRRLDQEDPF